MANSQRGISTSLIVISVIVIIVAIVGVLAYISMTSHPATTTTTTTTISQPKKIKVAYVTGGDETDQGWASIGLKSIQTLAQLYPIDLSISKNVPYPQQEQVLRQYAEANYDVIITDGGQFISTVINVAKDYPNIAFVIMAGANLTLPPNTVILSPWFSVKGMYLAGVLAGKMTKTNAIGVVMGEWYPYISAEFYAFKEGVKSVNPKAVVYPVVAGTWGDASLGFQLAQSLIKNYNVDIILHIADLTGRGVISAAQQYGIMVIGTCDDQAVLAPDNMLTSVMLNKTMYYDLVIKSVLDGTFKANYGGKVLNLDISYLAPFHRFDDKIPSDVKQLLTDLQKKIETGEFKVPLIITESPPPPS
jgi:basic membrane protein A